VTVYYSDSEFLSAGDWVYNNFDSVSGVSFLPRSDHTYAQAPYEAIDEAAYEELLSQMPKDVDWKGLSE
jgi:ribonucleoside-diphosphate reductase alpha chain